jgi:acyl-CoA synthetase (AMP-forming)/AMP-acid ligase II
MTGDLFSRDAEGHYFYQGRVDDMIVYRGRNIYPVELENVLLQYPGIEKACVVPLSAQNGETELGAAICVRNPVNLSDLREFASRRGPLWATVRFVQVLPELRLTSAGKVDRGETGRVVQEGYQAEWNVPKHESVRGTSNERA